MSAGGAVLCCERAARSTCRRGRALLFKHREPLWRRLPYMELSKRRSGRTEMGVFLGKQEIGLKNGLVQKSEIGEESRLFWE